MILSSKALFPLQAKLCLLSASDVEEKGVCAWMEGHHDGAMLWRQDEVRGKRIHPLGGIMRGSSCLPLGQTAHRCEGASGPDRAEGERWSPCAMTSFPGARAPTNTSTTPSNSGPPHRLKTEIIHALNSPEKTPVCRTFWAVLLLCCLAKLCSTCRGTACQRLISASPPLPSTNCRIQYSHGWVIFFKLREH